jgi:hypothetical protein
MFPRPRKEPAGIFMVVCHVLLSCNTSQISVPRKEVVLCGSTPLLSVANATSVNEGAFFLKEEGGSVWCDRGIMECSAYARDSRALQ